MSKNESAPGSQPANPPADPYETRVVAVIDILGFSELVKRADKEPGLRATIRGALDQARDINLGTQYGGVRVQNVSDTVIISAPDTQLGFWTIILSVDALAFNLLNAGILLRGGITVDGISHEDHAVFGVAVVEAHRLESAVAEHPRVILGRKAVDRFSEYRDSALNGSGLNVEFIPEALDTISRDSDGGVWFVDYLKRYGEENFSPSPDLLLVEQGRAVRGIMQQKLDETVDNPQVFHKLSWFARYWNRTVISGYALPELAAKLAPIGLIELPGES